MYTCNCINKTSVIQCKKSNRNSTCLALLLHLGIQINVGCNAEIILYISQPLNHHLLSQSIKILCFLLYDGNQYKLVSGKVTFSLLFWDKMKTEKFVMWKACDAETLILLSTTSLLFLVFVCWAHICKHAHRAFGAASSDSSSYFYFYPLHVLCASLPRPRRSPLRL